MTNTNIHSASVMPWSEGSDQ